MSTVLDGHALAAQFPVLQRRLDDQPLVYLDSANTSQKPQIVIDAMTTFLEQSYAPINRSAYRLAAEIRTMSPGASILIGVADSIGLFGVRREPGPRPN